MIRQKLFNKCNISCRRFEVKSCSLLIQIAITACKLEIEKNEKKRDKCTNMTVYKRLPRTKYFIMAYFNLI